MSLNKASLLDLLASLKIPFEVYDHPAVFTTKDIVRLTSPIPGQDTKNLFLRDEKRTVFILVCVKADTRVHLKDLGRGLGIKGITFGSPEEMLELIGTTPGSVCVFALANDSSGKVRGYIDDSIQLDALMQNHPLENTSTVVLKTSELFRVCAAVDHPLTRISIPARIEN